MKDRDIYLGAVDIVNLFAGKVLNPSQGVNILLTAQAKEMISITIRDGIEGQAVEQALERMDRCGLC